MKRGLVAFALALASCFHLASAQLVTMNQLDWFGGPNGVATLANSEWGVVGFDIPSAGSTQYLNVMAPDNFGQPQWLVRNLPIPDSSVEPISHRATVNIDLSQLGVSTGQSAAARPFGYSIGAFQTSMPGPIGTGLIGSQNRVYDFAYDFHDLGANLFNPVVPNPSDMTPLAAPRVVDPGSAPRWNDVQVVGTANIKHRVRRSMPQGLEEGVNECAPGSKARSLYWLHTEFGMDIGGRTLAQLHQHLVEQMHTDPAKGTSVENFSAAKRRFMEGRGTMEERNGQQVTWDWLSRMFNAGADVEIFFAYWARVRDADGNERDQWVGHAVTIMGKYDDGTNQWLLLRDDQNQGRAGTGEPYWTRARTTDYAGYLSLPDVARFTYVYYGNAEMVPAPGMLALLVLGLAARRRR